jgi:hypothetical protein
MKLGSVSSRGCADDICSGHVTLDQAPVAALHSGAHLKVSLPVAQDSVDVGLVGDGEHERPGVQHERITGIAILSTSSDCCHYWYNYWY